MLSARKAEQAAAVEKQRDQLEKAMLDLQDRHNKVHFWYNKIVFFFFTIPEMLTLPYINQCTFSNFLSYTQLWFQFSRLLSSIEGPHTAHLNTFVSVFAPANAAMETYTGARDLDFILNHFGEFPPRRRQAEIFRCFDIFLKQRKLHPTKLNNVKMFSLLVSTSVSPEEIGGNHRLTSLRVGQPPLWVRYLLWWDVKRTFSVFCL